MKFLVDAQLPRRLAAWLADAGYDAIHTLDLPQANRTLDDEVCTVADDTGRIVVTKDDDFTYSFLVKGQPRRLLLVSTGNISNADLLVLFQQALPIICKAFSDHNFIELTKDSILLRE